MICAICRRDRKPEKMQEGKRVCADRVACNRVAMRQLSEGTKAQSAAKRAGAQGERGML